MPSALKKSLLVFCSAPSGRRTTWVMWFIAAALMSSVCFSEVMLFNQAQLAEGRQLSDNSTSQTIKLPHSWNEESPQRKGIATYSLNFTLTKSEALESFAIYIPRIGNRFELFVNDELIQTSGKIDDSRFFEINKPILSIVSKNILFTGLNTIKIVTAGEAGRYAGLSTVSIGNFELLSKKYEHRQLIQYFSNLSLIIICGFISFISILYSYFTKNTYFLYLGISSLAWAFGSICTTINYFPYNYRILLFLGDFFNAVAYALMLLTLIEALRVRKKWLSSLIYFYLYLSFFLLVIYHDDYPLARTIYLSSTLGLFFIAIFLCIKHSLSRIKEQSILIFFSLLLAIFLFIYDDLYIYRSKSSFELMSYSKYTYILFMIVISTALANQFIKVNSFIHKNHARIDAKLKLVKFNLAQSYFKKSLVEKKLILQQERWRLMQDMHDGLGHRLIGLQQAVQDPTQTSESLNQLVKLSITELRTTIQSINTQHDNVSYMLGDLRERLDFLCAQYSKELQWSVEEMPVLPMIDETRISNTEKIILEVFTNIAKHSNAKNVKLTASFTPTENVTIEIEENGHGFIVHNTSNEPKGSNQSLGLLGIQRRANDSKIKLHFANDGKIIRLIISLR